MSKRTEVYTPAVTYSPSLQDVMIIITFAIRQSVAWASTLITHEHSCEYYAYHPTMCNVRQSQNNAKKKMKACKRTARQTDLTLNRRS